MFLIHRKHSIRYVRQASPLILSILHIDFNKIIRMTDLIDLFDREKIRIGLWSWNHIFLVRIGNPEAFDLCSLLVVG